MLPLNPSLSRVSWKAIEVFAAIGIFFMPISETVAETGLLIAVVLWAARKFPWDEKFSPDPLLFWSYALFMATAAASFAAVPHELWGTAFRGIFKWSKFFLVFFMMSELCGDRAAARRLLGFFLASVGVATANGYVQLIAGRDLIKGFLLDVPGLHVRMRGAFPSPNDFAAYLLLTLPIVFERFTAEKRWNARSVLWVAFLTLLAGALVSALSRGAVLALGASVVLWAVLARRPAVIAVALVSALPLMLSPMLRHTFLLSFLANDLTVAERISYWQTTLRMIRAHPFLGNGINLFTALFSSFAPEGQTYRGYAHNCYLQVWAETGVFGFLAFLAPVAAFFARQARRREGGLKGAIFCALTAFLFQSFIDTNFYSFQPAHAFWFLWGAYHALNRGERA